MSIIGSIFLAGCGKVPYEDTAVWQIELQRQCNSNTGAIWWQDPARINWYYRCLPKGEYCRRDCADFIHDAYSDMNDSWGNIWGFPESVSNSLDKCVDKCNK